MVESKTGDVDLSDFRINPFAKSLQVFFVDGRDKKGSVVDATADPFAAGLAALMEAARNGMIQKIERRMCIVTSRLQTEYPDNWKTLQLFMRPDDATLLT